MVELHSPVINEPIWMPPGGGVNKGESLYEAVKRECFEEVKLSVEPTTLMYLHELIKGNIHVLEYYFKCELLEGTLALGSDPERMENPLLLDAKWVSIADLSGNEMIRPEFLRNELSTDLLNWNGSTRFFPQSSNP